MDDLIEIKVERFIEIIFTSDRLVINSVDYQELKEIESFLERSIQTIRAKMLEQQKEEIEWIEDGIKSICINKVFDTYGNVFSLDIFLPSLRFSQESGLNTYQFAWSIINFINLRKWNLFNVIASEDLRKKIYYFNKRKIIYLQE